ncbi:MAG: hypothetical protein ACK5Z2_05350 [Bacteroidota bacterium]|jgi:hypothetical protein
MGSFFNTFDIGDFIALLTGGVIVWYTLETQKLRIVAVRQLTLMRQSLSSKLLPYVISGVSRVKTLENIDKKNIILKQIDSLDISKLSIPPLQKPKVSMTNVEDDMVFEVNCATDQIASHVFCFLFDSKSKRFKIPPYYLEVIAPRETGYFKILSDEVDFVDIKHLITNIYEKRGEYLINIIQNMTQKGDQSWIVPVFFDLAGRLYATPRIVYLVNGKFEYGKSDLLQPDTAATDIFAPPFESTNEEIISPTQKNNPH